MSKSRETDAPATRAGLDRRQFISASALASIAPVFVGCAASVGPSSPPPSLSPGSQTSSGARENAVNRTNALPQTDHHLTRDKTHNRWDRDLAPRLTMKSGETVTVETREASDGHFTPASISADVATRDRSKVHPLTGPIYVQGAAPGDTLQVDILGYELPQWGWTCISPPAGFLGDAFSENFLHVWHFNRSAGYAELKPGVRIPIDQPFLGVIGLAWNEPGSFRTIPPRAQGGNMDIRYLTTGSTVYLPVDLPGALLSVGDGHAAQGDGEVCISAIECDLTAALRLTLRPDLSVAEPQYETDAFYATTGFGTALEVAAKKAVQFMVEHLMARHGLNRNEAYVLCSVAADLKICEAVDMPHYLVSAHLPKSILA